MRNFYNHNVYTVDGKPFYGRFSFYKLHTTEKVIITDESGIAYNNPMLSDAEGRTDMQVFLPDEDVTVVMEKYIGGANMSDDMDNIRSWVEVLTFDNLKNTTVVVTGDGQVNIGSASTMEDLRNMDFLNTNYAVLLGYYTLGDMPLQYYKLVDDNTSLDDGGSIIRVDSTHVWKMIPQQILDVRSFGVFPSNDPTSVTAYNSQLRLAFTYARSLGMAVYMPNIFPDNAYYLLEGGDYALNNTLYVAGGVHISGKTGTDSSLTVDKVEGAAPGFLYFHSLEVNTGRLILTTKKAYASWMNSWYNSSLDIIATEEFVIDNHLPRNKEIANINKVTISQASFTTGSQGVVTFDNIHEFNSPRCIALDAQVEFKNMTHVTDSWFEVDNEHQDLDLTKVVVYNTCTTIATDFVFIQNYVNINYDNGIRIFNLDGRTLPRNDNRTYENCTFSNGVVDQINVNGTSAVFDNVTLSFSPIMSSGLQRMEISNSKFNGSYTMSPTHVFKAYNCVFTGTGTASVGLNVSDATDSCTIKDCIISGYVMRVPHNAFISGCTFDSTTASGTPTSITAVASLTTNYISMTFSDNVLTGGKLWLDSWFDNPITVKNSVFVGNSITNSTDGTNFIRWQEGLMATSGHEYIYRNNDGPDVLQSVDYATFIRMIPMIPEGSTPTTTKYITYGNPWRDPNHSQYYDMWYRDYKVYGVTVADFNLFAFGDDDYATKYAEWTFSCQENSTYPNDAYWGRDSGEALSVKGYSCSKNGIGAMTGSNIPNPWEISAGYNNTNGTMHVVNPPSYCDLKLKIDIYEAKVAT